MDKKGMQEEADTLLHGTISLLNSLLNICTLFQNPSYHSSCEVCDKFNV